MANENGKNEYELIGEIVSIFQRGRTWWANFQLDGKQRRESLGTKSLKEAKRQALILEASILQGRHHQQTKTESVAAGITAYLSDVRIRKRSVKTLEKYVKVFTRVNELADRLKAKRLDEVGMRFLDAYRQERVERDHANADSTVIDEIVIIRQMINFAMSRQMLATDPLAGLKIPKRRRRTQPWWNSEEVETILAASPPEYATIFTLLADTGFRIGELQFLTWDDVDFDRNFLHVCSKESWTPKDGDSRSVPMSARVRQLLEQSPRSSQWVVNAPQTRRGVPQGKQIAEPQTLRALKRVLNPLGLEGKLHTFRHSFLSHALVRGTPEAIVRQWAGHADWDILKMYTHIANRDSQAAMARLAELKAESVGIRKSGEPNCVTASSVQIQHNERTGDEDEEAR
jgi:integrase